MRRVLTATTLALVLAGCGGGSDKAPTGPTAAAVGQEAKRASAELRNGFLYDHNAAFNGGRTMRWLAPIPIFIVTDDPAFSDFLLAQFLAWETALGGVAGTPLFQPEAIARAPRKGIFFQVGDLPGDVIGFADPFSPFALRAAQTSRTPRAVQHDARFHLPEVLQSGAIQRCRITLDPDADSARNNLAVTIRHEIGHCLGFLGHVASGLMSPRCCQTAITGDVRDMLRQLYSLPPGTEVTP